MSDDEKAMAAALDLHFDETESYTGDEQRAFDGGFRAGLAYARQWRPLTEDTATWPEDGQFHAVGSKTSDGHFFFMYLSRGQPAHIAPRMLWLPLPEPPKEGT